MDEWAVETEQGSFSMYVALPKQLPAPGLILLQEVYGVNRFMKRITDYWASQGYLSVSPRLYWRLDSNETLDPETPGHRETALALGKRLDTDAAIRDIESVANHLRAREECSGLVGTSGYCLGGRLAYLCGARGSTDCNVSYYGVGIENHLDHEPDLRCPLLMHIGEADPWTPIEVRDRLAKALGENPNVTMHLYEGADHAFARPGATTDVPELRELANKRTLEFLAEHLSPRSP